MFYYPNRQRAMRIQQTLETLYQGIGGHYHYGDGAWEYVQKNFDVSADHITSYYQGQSRLLEGYLELLIKPKYS